MKLLSTLIVVMLLTACQSNSNNRQRIDYDDFIYNHGLQPQDRVQHFKFQGWQPLDDRYLILSSNQRRSFLIKLMSACVDMPFAIAIKVKQQSGVQLNAKFDSIEVSGPLNQECTIHSIYQMDRIQRQALLDLSKQPAEIRG